MKKWFVFLLFALPAFLQGQLLPSIGLSALPSDADPICPITPYLGNFDTSGYFPGDQVPDFTLHTVNGTPVNLATELQAGLPVLLISSSYTCPVFRNKILTINQVDSIYQGQLKVFVVYTPEAHPVIDPSPYSGTVWTTSQNQTAGILFRQPTTYGERKAMIDTLLQARHVRPTVLVDGPCNEWWLHYGPAPNNATLIKPDGTVFAKQDWFHNAPNNIFCDIDSLLGTNSGLCIQNGNNGNFTFALDADSVVIGHPGDVLDVHATLTNNSATDNVVLDIAKLSLNLPSGWTTALCADICYSTTTSQAQIVLGPSQVQPFTFYFYTDAIPASGDVNVGFRNNPHPNNQAQQRFYGSTLSNALVAQETPTNWKAFPSPANDIIHFSRQITQVEIFDAQGKAIGASKSPTDHIVVSGWPRGIYYIRAEEGSQTVIVGN
jgi:hypothetical protein